MALLEEVAARLGQGRRAGATDGGKAVGARLDTVDVTTALPPQVAEEASLLRGGMLRLHDCEELTVLMKSAETLTRHFVVRVVPGQQIVHVG